MSLNLKHVKYDVKLSFFFHSHNRKMDKRKTKDHSRNQCCFAIYMYLIDYQRRRLLITVVNGMKFCITVVYVFIVCDLRMRGFKNVDLTMSGF